MYSTKVTSTDLDSRIDAEFYSPDALRCIERIHAFEKCETLGSIIEEGYRVVYHGTDSINGIDDSNLLPFLSPSQIDNNGTIDFSKVDKLPIYYKDKYRKGLAKSGELLIEVKGNVSKIAIVPDDFPENLLVSGSLYKATINTEYDSRFILSYLKSKHGQILKNRLTSNTIISYLGKDDLYSIPVLKISYLAQTYIGNKVRQAELLREKCIERELEFNSEMLNVFLGKPKPNTRAFKRQSVDLLTQNRLDPDFYSSISQWSKSEIQNGPYKSYTLGELTIRIKDGPGGWGVSTNDYRPHGVPVIRSVNIMNGECDLTGSVYISEEKHQELIGHEAKKGSVVLSVRGTVGRAAVFEDDVVNFASLNAAVVTIDCKESLNPYYLAAFFNSSVGKTQANRIANGAVQLNMNLTETASNLIPLPPTDVQEKIERIYRKLISARKISRMLVKASKSLVEALIEGKVFESELIAAQQALENDDNAKDKAILCKITDKGYAVKSGNPLFSDLDALYELLDEAELFQQEKDHD